MGSAGRALPGKRNVIRPLRYFGSGVRAFTRFRAGGRRKQARYSKEIFTLYVKGYPLFSVIPLLISPLGIKCGHQLGLDWIPGLM